MHINKLACVHMHTHLLQIHKLDIKRMLMLQRRSHSSKVKDSIKLFDLEPQKFFLFLCIALLVELLLLLMKWKFIPLLISTCSGWAKDVPIPLPLDTAGTENTNQHCSLADLEGDLATRSILNRDMSLRQPPCKYENWGDLFLNSILSILSLQPMGPCSIFCTCQTSQTKLFTFSWAFVHGICLGAQLKIQIPVLLSFLFGWLFGFWGFFLSAISNWELPVFQEEESVVFNLLRGNDCPAAFWQGTKSNLAWNIHNSPWVFFWSYFFHL